MATEIHGLSDLRTSLQKVGRDLQKQVMSQALKEGGKQLQAAAKRYVHRDTGILQRSIRVYKRRGSAPSELYFAVYAGGSVKDKKHKGRYRLRSDPSKADPYYARFHEEGTRFTSANPFMQRALAENSEAAIDAIAAKVRGYLES